METNTIPNDNTIEEPSTPAAIYLARTGSGADIFACLAKLAHEASYQYVLDSDTS